MNKKQNYFLKQQNKFEKQNSIIEKMMQLSNDKFVIINKDCEIQIYQANNNKNLPAKEIKNILQQQVMIVLLKYGILRKDFALKL